MRRATEQAQWARQQGWQKGILHSDFLKENLKDPALAESFMRSHVKQARKTALVLGSALLISLVAVVYAFVQQTVAQRNDGILSKEKKKLNQCEAELQKQNAQAKESEMIVLTAIEEAQLQLTGCQKKSNQ